MPMVFSNDLVKPVLPYLAIEYELCGFQFDDTSAHFIYSLSPCIKLALCDSKESRIGL
jgi:hypothetical protein